MSTLSTDHHPTLRHADREAIGIELQAVLAVLTDLALTGKHAHWNVQGPNFRALHLHLDELVEQWRDEADAVAERAVALGHAPDGRARDDRRPDPAAATSRPARNSTASCWSPSPAS